MIPSLPSSWKGTFLKIRFDDFLCFKTVLQFFIRQIQTCTKQYRSLNRLLSIMEMGARASDACEYKVRQRKILIMGALDYDQQHDRYAHHHPHHGQTDHHQECYQHD